jgi:hypothetical protein
MTRVAVVYLRVCLTVSRQHRSHQEPDGRTNFVLYAFIRKGGRSRLAEEDNAPLSTLSKFQAFIVDLVCQLACWS